MGRKRKIVIIVAPIVVVFGLLVYFISTHNFPVLQTAGPIASKERTLMIVALALSAIVVVPVYVLTIMIAIRYRETNTKAKYDPDWDHSNFLEAIWWIIPMIIIAVLSVITWNSSHSLDPYKPIASSKQAINVEVVALDWKWLFIYPQQGVASVNRLEMPVNTPVHFDITSDTVMNSLWIPALSGQIYAMPGMTTQLNLEASKQGSFYGSSANISGAGFSGMNFRAVSVSSSGFNSWLNNAKASSSSLNTSTYEDLTQPSQNNPISYYKNPTNGLFNSILMQYMEPGMQLGQTTKTMNKAKATTETKTMNNAMNMSKGMSS